MRNDRIACHRHGRARIATAARVLLMTPLLATAIAAFPASARDIGHVGGDGGGEFNSRCRPNDVVIGFNMRSGTALDAIVPICIPLNAERTEWAGQAYEPTPYKGGGGGSYQKIACRPGDAVRHFHVYAGPWSRLTVVKHVRMTCQDLNSGNWYDVVPGQIAGTVTSDKRFSCGDGEWGTGIYGKHGLLVDRLGFSCDRIAAANTACVAYADQAVAAAQRAGRTPSCRGLQPAGRWSLDRSHHLNWCNTAQQAWRDSETGARAADLARCERTTGTDVPPEWRDMLNAHNERRKRHCTPPLKWSAQLADKAQKWADTFSTSHEPGVNGENMMNFGPAYPATSDRTAFENSWYCEIKWYDFDNPKVVGGYKNGCDPPVNAHFTQVVWKDSLELGCARATKGSQTYWVCRYSPPGNFNADKPGVLAANVLRPTCQ